MKTQRKVIKEEDTHDQRSGRLDETKGTWLPFRMVLRREGGHRDPDNVRAAVTYVLKCMIIGWVMYSTMAERLQFFHVRHTSKDYFDNAWQKKSTSSAEPQETMEASTRTQTTQGTNLNYRFESELENQNAFR